MIYYTLLSIQSPCALHVHPSFPTRRSSDLVAYLLFDERIAASARAADPFFARVVLPRTGRRGTTLEDIAKQFELDVNGLRSEEHTSELQSHSDLVCRLLLEKKKIIKQHTYN